MTAQQPAVKKYIVELSSEERERLNGLIQGQMSCPASVESTEREELSRLRRENRQLRLEREILSKAATWFARETNTIPPKGSGE